jgi:hypothetical protein
MPELQYRCELCEEAGWLWLFFRLWAGWDQLQFLREYCDGLHEVFGFNLSDLQLSWKFHDGWQRRLYLQGELCD